MQKLVRLTSKMAGDLSHFLLPNSRLPNDVYFLVGGVEVAAHKSLLASKHQIFDQMFYEDEAGSALNTVKVCTSSINFFDSFGKGGG